MALVAASLSLGHSAIAGSRARLHSHAVNGFEKSAFLREHTPKRKSTRSLKTGGSNYSYAFVDPEGTGESVSVELSSEPFLITHVGVVFHGTRREIPPRGAEEKLSVSCVNLSNTGN
ncbi:MAG: hypothetical protein MZW92_29735 [Comamonadaceae bacterium]|nr:hypothetical protein [Comamonadaceae bacterium]